MDRRPDEKLSEALRRYSQEGYDGAGAFYSIGKAIWALADHLDERLTALASVVSKIQNAPASDSVHFTAVAATNPTTPVTGSVLFIDSDGTPRTRLSNGLIVPPREDPELLSIEAHVGNVVALCADRPENFVVALTALERAREAAVRADEARKWTTKVSTRNPETSR